jgi:LEA14-like dessication related protein
MNRIVLRIAIIALVGLAVGCQARSEQLKDASMRVELDGLVRDSDGLALHLLVLNPNDHFVLVGRASVSFRLEDYEALSQEVLLDLDIAPRNRERIRVTLSADGPVLELLASLDEGERTRLAYTLETELELQDRRVTRSRIEAVLHRVPGQSGRYR